MMLERFSYRGWQNAYKVSNGVVELITTADVGPRILFYGFCRGENLFHEVEADAGKIGGSQFRLYGGHRLWVAPEVETTYYPTTPRFKLLSTAMRFVLAVSDTLRSSGCSTSPTLLASSATSSLTLRVKGLVLTARLSAFWNLAVAIICIVLVILRMLRTALRRLTIARALAIGRGV